MSYIPTDDNEALVFMQNFANVISANPAVYGLTAADATGIAAAVSLYAASLPLAQNPPTRTSVTIEAKDNARNSAEQIVRQFAMVIKQDAGVSSEDKIAIGVRPPSSERDPIPVPSSSPLLNVLGATPFSHTLRYADTTTPDSRAKPAGATSLQLFCAIGDEQAPTPDGAPFVGAFTKNPVGIAFDAEDDGKVATYWGRWANRKGEVGPWSLAATMRIAA